MQRSTWRLTSEDGVHVIDMPPSSSSSPPPPPPRGKPSRQFGWSIEKCAVGFKKFNRLYIVAAILILCLVTTLWLCFSRSVVMDDIARRVLKLLADMRMPQSDSHNELAMTDFAVPLVSPRAGD